MTNKQLFFTIYFTEYLFHSLMVKCIKPLLNELKQSEKIQHSSFYRSNYKGESVILALEPNREKGPSITGQIQDSVQEHVKAFFESNTISSIGMAGRGDGFSSMKLFQNRPKNTIECLSLSEEPINNVISEGSDFEQHRLVAQRVSEIILDLYSCSPSWGIEASMLYSIHLKLICGCVYLKGTELGSLVSFLQDAYESLISSENIESIEWAKQTSAELFEERKSYLMVLVTEKLQSMEGNKPLNELELQKWNHLVSEIYDFQKEHQQQEKIWIVSSLLSFVDNQLRIDNPYSQVIFLILIKTLKAIRVNEGISKEHKEK